MTGTTLTVPRELHKHGISVCALEPGMNSYTYIQNLFKKNPIRVDLELIVPYKLVSVFECA